MLAGAVSALSNPGVIEACWERAKLPTADAGLSVGPVWLAETIEPMLKAGGPEQKPRGGRPSVYVVSARLKTGRFPSASAEDAERWRLGWR
jgi:hypothetical protein